MSLTMVDERAIWMMVVGRQDEATSKSLLCAAGATAAASRACLTAGNLCREQSICTASHSQLLLSVLQRSFHLSRAVNLIKNARSSESPHRTRGPWRAKDLHLTFGI